jgi:hypothetical protein
LHMVLQKQLRIWFFNIVHHRGAVFHCFQNIFCFDYIAVLLWTSRNKRRAIWPLRAWDILWASSYFGWRLNPKLALMNEYLTFSLY